MTMNSMRLVSFSQDYDSALHSPYSYSLPPPYPVVRHTVSHVIHEKNMGILGSARGENRLDATLRTRKQTHANSKTRAL